MSDPFRQSDSRLDTVTARQPSGRKRLRNYFLTGVVVAGPLAVTAWLINWFIGFVDGWVKPLIPSRYLPETYLPFAIPGFGVVVALIGLTLLGFLTANLVGRSLIDAGESILVRMPIVRSIYKSVKQVFETVFAQSGTSFRTVGLVQYPAPGQWSIVFLSAPPTHEIASRLGAAGDGASGEEFVSVFLPCAPNPMTGFYFYLPRRDVLELSITVDDAAKIVMSAGMIQPDSGARAPSEPASSMRPIAALSSLDQTQRGLPLEKLKQET